MSARRELQFTWEIGIPPKRSSPYSSLFARGQGPLKGKILEEKRYISPDGYLTAVGVWFVAERWSAVELYSCV